MMDPAYFVGKRELLEWINSTLGLQIGKVEETASGIASAQLIYFQSASRSFFTQLGTALARRRGGVSVDALRAHRVSIRVCLRGNIKRRVFIFFSTTL